MNYRKTYAQSIYDGSSYKEIFMTENIKPNESQKKDVKTYDLVSLKNRIIYNLIDKTIENLNNDEKNENENINKQKICSFYPNCRNKKCYFLHVIKNEKKMIKFLDNIISNLDY
jgi:hypothetical protein